MLDILIFSGLMMGWSAITMALCAYGIVRWWKQWDH